MAINRISTYSNFQSTVRDFNGVQARLADLQGQISSGYKSEDYKGLNGQVELFSSLENKISKSKSYIDNNTLVQSRVQITSDTLGSIVDTVDAMKNLIVTRRGATGNSLNFGQQMKTLRDQFTGLLNTNVEGRFLFSGTATDQKPIADPLPAPVVEGAPDAGYYRGSAQDISARIDDYIDIKYNVRADNPAFQKIFAAIDQSIQADATNTDAGMSAAFDLIQSGLKDVISVQGSTNANLVAIAQVNDRHDSLKLYWQGLSEQISKTDILTTSTQVAVDQGVLSATFQSFSRINQLRLSDFLR